MVNPDPPAPPTHTELVAKLEAAHAELIEAKKSGAAKADVDALKSEVAALRDALAKISIAPAPKETPLPPPPSTYESPWGNGW